MTDLQLLSSVLTDITYESQHLGFDGTMTLVLNDRTVKISTLFVILNGIEPGLASGSTRIRRRTALDATMKFEKIKVFQEALEKLKDTLLLAQQSQYR